MKLYYEKVDCGGTQIGFYDATLSDLKAAIKSTGAPYLVNRGDGVNGHYVIARRNCDGYTEFWSQEKDYWCSAGSVFNLGILEWSQEP